MPATLTRLDAESLKPKFEQSLSYQDYLATGTAEQQANWTRVYEQTSLTEAQSNLLEGFTRQMRVLCVSGIWCGDCVQQGPLLQRIAEGSPRIELSWVDRDDHDDLADQVVINAGRRVPVVLFCAEDYEPVGWYGDRTLSRYREMAQRQLGAACPLPGAAVPEEAWRANLEDWLNEFERVQLLLRLSGRLRKKHGD